jgi:hypothetical protein
MSSTDDAAVSEERSEADAMGVDAWLTEDHSHVVIAPIACRIGRSVLFGPRE